MTPRSVDDTAGRRERRRYDRRHWTEAEARRFLRANSAHHLYAVWLLALDTGGRRAEISRLTWSDIDIDGATVDLTDTRTGDVRTVAISPRTASALRAAVSDQIGDCARAGGAWLGGTPGSSGRVAVTRLGQPCRPEYLTRAFERAQLGLDLPPLPFYGLRTTMARIALERGASVRAIGTRLGSLRSAAPVAFPNFLDDEREP